MSDKSFEDIKKEKMDMLVDMLMIDIGEYIDGKLTKEELTEKIEYYNYKMGRVKRTGSIL
jgi:hypothetical protein